MRTESRTPPSGPEPIHKLPRVNGLRSRPVGAVLAGGRGRRIGGDKAIATLAGRPLLSYPVRAMRAVVDQVVVVAKPSTALPALGEVTVWTEPEQPSHPLVGIAEALRRAPGGWVLVCAGDMPFVPVALLESLVSAGAPGRPGAPGGPDPGAPAAVVAASASGALQPLLGCYGPACLEPLAAAAHEAVAPARAVVAALEPLVVPVTDPRALFNVNSASDLREAEALLAAG
jgi:molybdenum cofactor guanylyltransferase